MISLGKFRKLAAAGYNHIPICRYAMADHETPLSVYRKLADGPFSYLLESAIEGSERWNRYSFMGLSARCVIKVFGRQVRVERQGETVERVETDDPLAFIRQFRDRFRVPELPGLPRFVGGLVGYFGYDTVRFAEPHLFAGMPADELELPDIMLMVSDEVMVFDSFRSRMMMIRLVDPAEPSAYERACRELEALHERLDTARTPRPRVHAGTRLVREEDFHSRTGREKFMESVGRIREYIIAGDAMQVVLSHLMSLPVTAPPVDIYRALRSLNPSPYMYLMDFDGFHIVSSSPEILARLENRDMTSRPLAGTRRRGRTDEEDQLMAAELLGDPKELAEHLMLIDLARNDLGRVAETGTVRVQEKMQIERYSHVMHISSTVVGRLAASCDALDLLRATLPVGTLSGAPKIRAMEIIDELESVKRGVYGGAVGYLGWNGNMDMAIAIRTAVIKDDILYLTVGGGIVADSDPHLEWEETMNKARAMFRAVMLAESGFRLNPENP